MQDDLSEGGLGRFDSGTMQDTTQSRVKTGLCRRMLQLASGGRGWQK